MVPPANPVTQLLQAWRNGDQNALNSLMPMVYDQLRSIAGRYLRAENPGHTLGATGVVHEAFIRLVETDVGWQDRAHFLAIASRVMRRILVDHARAHGRAKRGGAPPKISLDDALIVSPERADEVVHLDDALTRLSALDERKSRILEMLYFGGLTYVETAEAVGISEVTVHRELKLAKAWLRRDLGQGA
jgi:RNA polymerase sigma factor (TIGR02999 family)